MTLTPACGRDYKSAKAAKADFLAGKDWVIADMAGPLGKDCGRYCNVEDLKKDFAGQTFQLRFAKLTKLTMVKVPKA